MYDTHLTKRFKATYYKAVKLTYAGITSKSTRQSKVQMLTELDEICERLGKVAKIACYRALLYREYSENLIKYQGLTSSTKITVDIWETTAHALEDALREAL